MKNKFGLPFLFFGFYCSAIAMAQSSANFTITADIDCNWTFDGRPMGLLKADNSKVISSSPGEHLIQAVTTDGLVTIRTEVQVDQSQKVVEIQLKNQNVQRLAKKQADADAALAPTWIDPATSLMWTRNDNGSDVNWNQARSYCSNLKLADYSNWRLPTIEELWGIYDPSINSRQLFDYGVTYSVHVKGNLKITGWHWSSSQGKSSGQAWQLDFGIEQPQVSFPLSFSFSSRALCVRSSEESRE